MSRRELRKLNFQLGEVDSDGKLDEFLLKTREKTDLTFVPYMIGTLILTLVVFGSPFPLPLLVLGGYILIFILLKWGVLPQIIKARLKKYYNLVANVVYRYSGREQEYWARVILRLSSPELIPPDNELVDLLKSYGKGIPRSKARFFKESYERIREGTVRSLYTETPDHKYRMLFVEYVNGNDHPVPTIVRTRFGRTSVNAFDKYFWYVGNYRLYTAPELDSGRDQLLVFSAWNASSSLNLTMPNLLETSFMIANLNRVRMKKTAMLLKASNESMRQRIKVLEDYQKTVDATLISSEKVSQVLNRRLLTRIETTRTRAELEVKPVTWFNTLVSLIRRFSLWIFGTIFGLVIGMIFEPYLSSLNLIS